MALDQIGNCAMEVFLTLDMIKEILRVTEEEFQQLHIENKKRGVCSKERVEFILGKLQKDPFRWFSCDESALDWKHMARQIRKMLAYKAPLKLKVGEIRSRMCKSDSRMSIASSSNMSYEEFTGYEDEHDKRVKAEDKLAELETKVALVQPLLDLFAKDTKTRGGKSFGPNLDALILKNLANGRSAASIRDFLITLSEQFTFLIDQQQNQRELAVPSIDYIEQLRECLGDFNQVRLEKFVDEAESVTISTDDSPSLNAGENFLSLGLIDETGLYVNVGFMQNSDKTGKGISEAMQKALDNSALKSKILSKLNNEVAIMSDSAHAQRMANRLVLERLKSHETNSAICLMHTTSNCEKRAFSCVSDKFQECLHSSKLVFGSRKGSGFQKICLKQKLNEALGQRNRSVFLTDKGSRFGVNASNARALILNKSAIAVALSQASSSEINANRLKYLIGHEWDELVLELGAFALFYYIIISPFHSIISQTIPWGVGKAAIETAQARMLMLRNSTISNPLEKLCEIGDSLGLSEQTEQAISVVRTVSINAPKRLLFDAEDKLRQISSAALIKFEKDTSVLLGQSISEEEFVPLTNRRAEASFAAFKANERKFISLSKELLVNTTIAKINHVSQFISDMVSELDTWEKSNSYCFVTDNNFRLLRIRPLLRVF